MEEDVPGRDVVPVPGQCCVVSARRRAIESRVMGFFFMALAHSSLSRAWLSFLKTGFSHDHRFFFPSL